MFRNTNYSLQKIGFGQFYKLGANLGVNLGFIKEGWKDKIAGTWEVNIHASIDCMLGYTGADMSMWIWEYTKVFKNHRYVFSTVMEIR